MASYDPEFVQIMRAVLDEVMTKVPAGRATPGIEEQVAVFILKSAANGQTSYRGLLARVSDRIPTILSELT
jgi:hypothetical protein